jgi:hypothetical protein
MIAHASETAGAREVFEGDFSGRVRVDIKVPR